MFFDQIGTMLWSDNWWLEADKAYICSARGAMVFCVDMIDLKCDYLFQIPDCKFMEICQNSYCIKYKNELFCISYNEKDICCYEFEKGVWEEIEIGYQNRIMICFDTIQIKYKKIWMVEVFGRKLYLFDFEKKIVEKKYELSEDKNVFTGQYIIVGENMYCVAKNEIHCIDLKNGDVVTKKVLDENEQLFTICYDGFNFWLSGSCKAVYVWNPQCGVVKVIEDLVKRSNGICTESNIIQKDAVLFAGVVSLGEYVWCIPLQCNVPILYISKSNYEVKILEIEEEWETEEGIAKRGSPFKYAIEYVRRNRYIGIVSCKNQILFEIDTVGLCTRKIEYTFRDETLQILARKAYAEKGVLSESKEGKEIFSILLDHSEKNGGYRISDVGSSIYREIMQ